MNSSSAPSHRRLRAPGAGNNLGNIPKAVPKKKYTLSDGREFEAERIVIPFADIKSKTRVHILNDRNQDALSEFSVSDILPSIRINGVRIEGIVLEANDGIYELLDCSRRSFACQIAERDLPVWVIKNSDQLSQTDLREIIKSTELQKPLSYRERGKRYARVKQEQNYKSNAEIAKYLGLGEETVRKCVVAYSVDLNLVKVFPDYEGIPNGYYNKLKKLQAKLSANNVSVSDFISGISFPNYSNSSSTSILQMQKEVLELLIAHHDDLYGESAEWGNKNNFFTFNSSIGQAKSTKSLDGEKIKYDLVVPSNLNLDEFEALVLEMKKQIFN
ncbi:ParB N-terminal domain-containing protein [Photobacterium leiognathi]|uniref:ParB N-terminal domain-containing protein n=1 Tax=Photobacterium leiognathi TaxID=553611 RepID=UPI001EDE1FA0|nr:ParB N-terminal domain-containing protein [Photobacterium leiognathi]MCG3883716.1 ParB N-terminal domain-containing protein [Photobacterium leiognathi]